MWGLFHDAAILRVNERVLALPGPLDQRRRVLILGPASIRFLIRRVGYVPQNVR
jgi:hypothetical protein